MELIVVASKNNKKNMIRKLIFLVFRNNYRIAALGNFGKSTKYDDILVISFGGRLKSIIGKVLFFFKLGKFISIDGDPLLNNENLSINLWYTGTSLKISKQFRHLNNNFVNMNNPIIKKEQKLFQIYPIIKKNYKINKKIKIIFMGKIFFQSENSSFINSKILKKSQKKIMNDFSLIDKKNFWSELNCPQEDIIRFESYKIFKTYLRERIIIEINKNFKNYFDVYGEDKKQIGLEFLSPIYNAKKVKEIYKGNICIDTGSILGSLSLHPRSIQIIESGGLLIQSKQEDSDLIWGQMSDKVVFNNINILLEELEKYLLDPKKCNETLEMIFRNFSDSKIKIKQILNKSLFDLNS